MGSTVAIAQRYAGTFLRDPRSQEAEVLPVLGALHASMQQSGEILLLLRNRSIPAQLKLRALRTALGKSLTPFLETFLGMVATHDRMDCLPEIIARILELSREIAGVRIGEVQSARPLTPAQLESIAERLKASSGFTYQLSNTIDPSLIGGFLVRSGDRLFDHSLRSRLNELHGSLSGASTHG